MRHNNPASPIGTNHHSTIFSLHGSFSLTFTFSFSAADRDDDIGEGIDDDDGDNWPNQVYNLAHERDFNLAHQRETRFRLQTLFQFPHSPPPPILCDDHDNDHHDPHDDDFGDDHDQHDDDERDLAHEQETRFPRRFSSSHTPLPLLGPCPPPTVLCEVPIHLDDHDQHHGDDDMDHEQHHNVDDGHKLHKFRCLTFPVPRSSIATIRIIEEIRRGQY